MESDGRPLALIYTRISSDQGPYRGASLAAQLARGQEYAASNAWAVDGVYSDVMSGARDDRPQYQALLSHVRRLRSEERAVAVIIASVDRLGRRMLEGLRCLKELATLVVPVHSVSEGGIIPEIVANVLLAVAQEERLQTSRRITSIRQHVASQGWCPVGRLPWGYRWRPATAEERSQSAPSSVLILDPAEAPFVQQMFERAAAGEPVSQLIRWMRTLPPEARGGRAMPQEAVRKMLRSPRYVARSSQGDPDVLSRPVCRWPPLIDDRTWIAVQERRQGPLSGRASGRFLLSGFLRCSRCGGRSKASAGVSPTTGARGYCCSGSGACGGVYLGQRKQLDADVLRQVRFRLNRALPSTTDPLRLTRLWSQAVRPGSDTVRQAKRLEQAIERAQQRLDTAGRLLERGDLDQGGYALVCEAIESEARAARQEMSVLRRRAERHQFPSAGELGAQVAAWKQVLQDGSTTDHREILGQLVEEVHAQRRLTGGRTPTIQWTPLGEALGVLGRLDRKEASSRTEGT